MKENYQFPDHGAERMRTGSAKRVTFAFDEDLRGLGQGKTYYIRTYGCQANVRDSETLSGMFGMMGFIQAGSP